jgi:hypothetical protein
VINLLKPEVHPENTLEILFLTHRKQRISITKTNQLMLFREIIVLYCENHMKHINTAYWQNA